MPPVLTCIALHVRDLDACILFYETYSGMRIVYDRSSGGLGRYQSAEDFSHLGFALRSRAAVDAIAE